MTISIIFNGRNTWPIIVQWTLLYRPAFFHLSHDWKKKSHRSLGMKLFTIFRLISPGQLLSFDASSRLSTKASKWSTLPCDCCGGSFESSRIGGHGLHRVCGVAGSVCRVVGTTMPAERIGDWHPSIPEVAGGQVNEDIWRLCLWDLGDLVHC